MIPKVWETIQNKIQDDIKSKGKIKSIFVKNMILLCGQVRNLTGINISKIFFKSINKKVFGGNLEQIHMGGGKSNSEVVSFFGILDMIVLIFMHQRKLIFLFV